MSNLHSSLSELENEKGIRYFYHDYQYLLFYIALFILSILPFVFFDLAIKYEIRRIKKYLLAVLLLGLSMLLYSICCSNCFSPL